MSASGHAVRRAPAPGWPSGPSPATIAARLDRIETAVMTLCEVERMRLAERGEDDGWTAMVRKVASRRRTDPTRSAGAADAPR